ncbi:glutamate--tRNA ligase [Candidatus Sneabacter namystus]|uniref:Glutamate--tRNA ligase n=1 Tax=Candidatus Sneabacter namystus TaxID=2601646 RepID=A0A5C0UI71_9RICK|nr:glutamate--tRNA ligase [Candidatus Sneabacter namystus]QEK39450.1 glutamate--tRNA ligase [Candidatus Sneabacter namystus]
MHINQVKTRFAPSPTGVLHLGGARTALLNYLFAKQSNGKFYVRIEDTDKERSSTQNSQSIIESLQWLELTWDEEIVFQSHNAKKHINIAKHLIDAGHAYYCFKQQEENTNGSFQSDKIINPWRDALVHQFPKDKKPTIRLKVPLHGKITLDDLVQGPITIENRHLEDVVLVKSNGDPTYMLSVVCDDHDMNISHIIRGDDHISNTFLQLHIYQAMKWDIPKMAHIPLIHNPDGTKLSKRKGAIDIQEYKNAGYLPLALCNYIAKLGCGFQDREIMSIEEMIQLFRIENINKAAARIDFDKLKYVNACHIKRYPKDKLVHLILEHIDNEMVITHNTEERIHNCYDAVVKRAVLLTDLVQTTKMYLPEFTPMYSDMAKTLLEKSNITLLENATFQLKHIKDFYKPNIENTIKCLAKEHNVKLVSIAMPIRACLTGITQSPCIFEMMQIIGKLDTIKRLEQGIAYARKT